MAIGIANLTLTDANLNKINKNLPNVNPAYLPEFGTDTVAVSAAISIKAAVTALNSLTTNSLNAIKLTVETDITNAEEVTDNG